MTVSDLITGSLRLLEVYGGGDPVEGVDLNDALLVFNEMINAWNGEHLAIYTIVNRLLALTATQGTYTAGPGGTLGAPRPVKIESAGIVQANGLRSDLKLDTSKEWAMIPEKDAQGKLPLRLYCDNDYPLAKVFIWPVPAQNCSLDFNSWDELADNLLLADIVDFPPSYLRAIRANLAVTLAPEYGRDPVPPALQALAESSKAKLFELAASNFAGTQDPPQQ